MRRSGQWCSTPFVAPNTYEPRPVVLGLQSAVKALGLVLARLAGERQARPEVAQQLVAGQHDSSALLLQGLGQVGDWGNAHQAALLVQGDCGVLSMQVLQHLLAWSDILVDLVTEQDPNRLEVV